MTKLDTRTKSYNTMDDHVFIQLKRSAFESGLEMEWRRRGLKTPRWGCWPGAHRKYPGISREAGQALVSSPRPLQRQALPRRHRGALS